MRLRLELRDGSRILGAPASLRLPLKFALGSVDLEFAKLAVCELLPDKESAVLQFRNGDRLTGVMGLEAFDLTTCFGRVKIPLAVVARVTVIQEGPLSGALLNVNFANTNKSGRAAIGLGDDDYWNAYVAPFAQSSSVAGLKLANGTATDAILTVINGGGHWGNKTGDPMMDSYVYPNSHSGNVTVILSNLPPGVCDFHLYGRSDPDGSGNESNSIFAIKSGSRQYGPAGAKKSGTWKATDPWVEGVHYVVLRNVMVQTGEAVEITVSPGFDGRPTTGVAVINGLQIAPAGSAPAR